MVNINSESTRSLHSPPVEDTSDDESTRTDRLDLCCSPTPSEAGLAQVSSCSSSSDTSSEPVDVKPPVRTDSLLQDVLVLRHKQTNISNNSSFNNSNNSRSSSSSSGCCRSGSGDGTQSMPTANWRKSTGWRRVSSQYIVSIWKISKI